MIYDPTMAVTMVIAVLGPMAIMLAISVAQLVTTAVQVRRRHQALEDAWLNMYFGAEIVWL